MPGTAVVQSGNYTLEIDAGFNIDGFTLDDPLKGVLAGYTTTTTRTNLITNPNFETNTTNWNTSNATITRVTTDAYVGTASLSIAVTALATDARIGQTTNWTAVAGTTYTGSAYLKNTAGNNRNMVVSLRFQNSSGVTVGETFGTVQATTVGGAWTRFSVTATAPATTASADLLIYPQYSAVSLSNVTLADACLVETGSTLLPYFDGTYANTYTGYTLTSQQWNGTTDASTSTATWGLNSSYIDSQYVLDGTTQFADVTDGTLNIAVRRGRRDQGDSFASGTMSFTLNDTLAGGVFNPFDTSSPYYNQYSQVPGLAPMRQVNLIRYDSTNTPEYIFRGKVVNYDYNFALGGLNTVTVYCADDMYLLSQTYMNELNVTAETSGARIETVLNLPEVDYPTGAARSIATGTVNLGHDSAYTVPAGTNVLAYLTQINDSAEFGRLFVSRDGVLTFQDRVGATLSPAVADFHDDGTNIKYDQVGITFEADQVVNRAVVTGLNGTSATATNTSSIATYFIQTDSITNSLLHDATEIGIAATYLLEPTPEARYTDVGTKYSMLTTAQRDTLTTVDIGDTITIEKTFPSGTGTTSLSQTLSVEGVDHQINFDTGHRITFYTAPTVIIYELILDDPVYGVIDADNVLG